MTLKNLLAVDDLAQRHGCGLNPKLRAMIEADLRFPAKATAPEVQTIPDGDHMPQNVVALEPAQQAVRKRSA